MGHNTLPYVKPLSEEDLAFLDLNETLPPEEDESEENELARDLEDLDWMFDRLCFMDLSETVGEEADELRADICGQIEDLIRMILKKMKEGQNEF